MTKQYDNTNKGVLFVNDRKEQDTHPDFKGSIDVNGVQFWLSAWRKETSKGETISLSIQPKDAAAHKLEPQKTNTPTFEDDLEDSTIPF